MMNAHQKSCLTLLIISIEHIEKFSHIFQLILQLRLSVQNNLFHFMCLFIYLFM